MKLQRIAFLAAIGLTIKLLIRVKMILFSNYYSDAFTSLLTESFDGPLIFFLLKFSSGKLQMDSTDQNTGEIETSGKIWMAAFYVPVAIIACGYLIALGISPNQNDWIGVSRAIPVFLCVFIGSALSIILALSSIRNKERNALLSEQGASRSLLVANNK